MKQRKFWTFCFGMMAIIAPSLHADSCYNEALAEIKQAINTEDQGLKSTCIAKYRERKFAEDNQWGLGRLKHVCFKYARYILGDSDLGIFCNIIRPYDRERAAVDQLPDLGLKSFRFKLVQDALKWHYALLDNSQEMDSDDDESDE